MLLTSEEQSHDCFLSYVSAVVLVFAMQGLPGRFSRGTVAATMMNAPLLRPDPPTPAIARPTMSIAEDCAAPQMADPTSNTKKNVR